MIRLFGFLQRWCWRFWRLETRLRLLSPARRKHWRTVFLHHPSLHDARQRGGDYAYTVFAGFYNDTVPRGFMKASDVEMVLAGR